MATAVALIQVAAQILSAASREVTEHPTLLTCNRPTPGSDQVSFVCANDVGHLQHWTRHGRGSDAGRLLLRLVVGLLFRGSEVQWAPGLKEDPT